jgi:pimeloyl-ACP methyl ester carboxylesterase
LVLISPAAPLRSLTVRWVTAQLLLRTTPGLGGFITRRAYERYSMEELTDLAYANLTADPSTVPEEMWHRSLALANWRKDQRWSVYAFSSASASMLRELAPRRYRRNLESVTCPTLLIHGDQDRVMPRASAVWIAGLRPDWHFEMMSGVGHLPMIERPHDCLELISDLMRSDSPAQAQSPSA